MRRSRPLSPKPANHKTTRQLNEAMESPRATSPPRRLACTRSLSHQVPGARLFTINQSFIIRWSNSEQSCRSSNPEATKSAPRPSQSRQRTEKRHTALFKVCSRRLRPSTSPSSQEERPVKEEPQGALVQLSAVASGKVQATPPRTLSPIWSADPSHQKKQTCQESAILRSE